MFSKNPRKVVQEIISYTIPEFREGKECYIAFNAFDPMLGKMRRKKIKLNYVPKKYRWQRAREIIPRLIEKLQEGWNPWIAEESTKGYQLFDTAITLFLNEQEKLLDDGYYEKDSVRAVKTRIRILADYAKDKIKYCYQFNKKFVADFLDYVYIERKVLPRTRNNYLDAVRTLSKWMFEKDYITERPEAEIKPITKKKITKKRTVISDKDLDRIFSYLYKENKHYLLACYLDFGCCIRPDELSHLKIKHIDFANKTIFIPADISKNDKDGVVSIPKQIMKLMQELGIEHYNKECYLFSKKFKPGMAHCNKDRFRKFWSGKLRPALNLPDNYQFYSLKDSGITGMLRANIPEIAVRDQARHSDLSTTNLYTPQSGMSAPDELKSFEW